MYVSTVVKHEKHTKFKCNCNRILSKNLHTCTICSLLFYLRVYNNRGIENLNIIKKSFYDIT